jgi:hypothetical protein
MSARAIGELIQPIMARAEALYGFQQILNKCPTAEGRKGLILAAWERFAVSDEDAQLLIEAYGLETA